MTSKMNKKITIKDIRNANKLLGEEPENLEGRYLYKDGKQYICKNGKFIEIKEDNSYGK
jgi:hypothetical protein